MRNEKLKKTILLTGDSAKKALAVGIIGCLVVICLLMFILYSWKRFKQPKSTRKLWKDGKIMFHCAIVGLSKEHPTYYVDIIK
jgi:hypothetical protein